MLIIYDHKQKVIIFGIFTNKYIANMVNSGLKKIISTDKVFDRIEEITRIDPKNYDVS